MKQNSQLREDEKVGWLPTAMKEQCTEPDVLTSHANQSWRKSWIMSCPDTSVRLIERNVQLNQRRRLTFRQRMMNIALNNIRNEKEKRFVSFYCMIYWIFYHAACSFLPAENIQRTSLTHLSCSSIFFPLSLSIYTVVSLVLVSKPTVPMLTTKKTYVGENKRGNCFLIRWNDREVSSFEN